MSSDLLFQPFTLPAPNGGLSIPNRLVMAPMTRSFSTDGIPPEATIGYYQRRASGQVGLLVTEGVAIERPAARNEPGVPDFFGPALNVWGKVVEAVHAEGGLIAPQLWHVGAIRGKGGDAWKPFGKVDSPSGIAVTGEQLYEPSTEEEIQQILEAYEQGARNARELGFDAVEIHAAHGYLIDQFFWGQSNQRSDQWGGTSIAERVRFGAEVVRAVRRGAGDTLPIITRLSQWKLQDYTAKVATTPEKMAQWLQPLVDAGTDAFHCSQRRFWEPEFEGSDLNFAGWARKLSGKPCITVGSVGLDGEFIAGLRGASSQPASLENLIDRLQKDEFDLVGVGRALLADPNWALKIRDGRLEELQNYGPADLTTLS